MEEDEYCEDDLNTSADIFANSSTDTVAESFPPPPLVDGTNEKLILSPKSDNLLDLFISENNNPRICCPFCIFDFGFEYILKEHIKIAHPHEIKTILTAKPGEIDFYECPFCEVKFFPRDLLPKHIMRKHEFCIVNMFSGFSPEKYVYCRFCPHKTMRQHYKLLIIHIEKKHFQVFEDYIIQKYCRITKHFDGLKDIETEELSTYTSPGLSLQMNKLTTEEINMSPSIKSILKPHTAYPIEATEKIDGIMFKTEVSVHHANFEVKPSRNARRKLRFDLPHQEGDESNKENTEATPKKRKKIADKSSIWLKFLHSKKETSVDSLDAKELSHFRCGICSEGFRKNSKLLEHVKKKHKGITLQAQYCCGDCDARFYRNSFLRRHCKYHHSPLCLKSTVVKDQGIF